MKSGWGYVGPANQTCRTGLLMVWGVHWCRSLCRIWFSSLIGRTEIFGGMRYERSEVGGAGLD